MDLRGKRALVMGLGVHGGGLGVARFLVGCGADVTVTDLRTAAALAPSLAALSGLPVRYVLGEHRDEDFRSHEIVVQNPGVPRESPFLATARAAGARIESEMTLFFRACPNPANILGITGTKGKTTTTLLVGAMLAQQFPDTVVAGNLRVSALEQLPRIGRCTPVVLELSSWQLEGLGEASLSPHFACVTNLSPDHLNRYGGMADYAEAKKQIFLHQDAQGLLVLNGDDPVVRSWAGEAPGRVVRFVGGPKHWMAPDGGPLVVTNGYGVSWNEGGVVEQLCDAADIRLPGAHNAANVAAAAALAKSYGLSATAIKAAIQEFGGVPHRLELVRELGGVRYINDTTATAPAAALAALKATAGPIVLLAGGADKALPFDEFALAVAKQVHALVLLAGSATPRLQAALELAMAQTGRSLTVLGPFDDFAAAIAAARGQAAVGGAVLLAPGCASFGMFANEFERGDEFRRIVATL